MNAPHDALPNADRLAALPKEDKERIGVAMRLRAQMEALLLEGLGASYDLMAGKMPADDVAKGLLDLQHSLRAAAEDMLKRPLKAAHAMAVLSGQTKLDEEAWLKRMRAEAAQGRAEREERSRAERFEALRPPSLPAGTEEAEPESGPRP